MLRPWSFEQGHTPCVTHLATCVLYHPIQMSKNSLPRFRVGAPQIAARPDFSRSPFLSALPNAGPFSRTAQTVNHQFSKRKLFLIFPCATRKGGTANLAAASREHPQTQALPFNPHRPSGTTLAKPVNPVHHFPVPFDREYVKQSVAALAARGVFIGTLQLEISGLARPSSTSGPLPIPRQGRQDPFRTRLPRRIRRSL